MASARLLVCTNEFLLFAYNKKIEIRVFYPPFNVQFFGRSLLQNPVIFNYFYYCIIKETRRLNDASDLVKL